MVDGPAGVLQLCTEFNVLVGFSYQGVREAVVRGVSNFKDRDGARGFEGSEGIIEGSLFAAFGMALFVDEFVELGEAVPVKVVDDEQVRAQFAGWEEPIWQACCVHRRGFLGVRGGVHDCV